MSNNRFANLFNLSEAEAIALLDTPEEKLGEEDSQSRYVAASQLAFFNSEAAIAALIRAIGNQTPTLDNKIARRKAIESLGKLKAKQGLAAIAGCLAEIDDTYTVENAVWAIGELETDDAAILEAVAQLLQIPNQSYRAVIHTLAKLGYKPALERIQRFMRAEDKTIASAAIATVYRFTGDESLMEQVMEFLFHPNVYARRLCIQDLIDTNYYPAIPEIVQTPVSLVFRMRGLRMLADVGVPSGQLQTADLLPSIETVLRDHPNDLQLIHAYDGLPSLERLIRELYETDFGRAYLATKTIIEHYPDAGAALIENFRAEAWQDYGAHYHVIKLLGWLRYEPGFEVILEGLNVDQPQFQKSKAAAAIALGELGDKRAIEHLQPCLNSKFWDLRLATIGALAKLGDLSGLAALKEDSDRFVRVKAEIEGAENAPVP
jgi:bilin biosynthesis protein